MKSAERIKYFYETIIGIDGMKEHIKENGLELTN